VKNRIVIAAVIGCMTLQACSSRPRDFTPNLAAPPTSQAEFDSAYAECQQLLLAKKLDANGRLASAGAGAGAGVATVAAGSATAAAVGGYGGLAAAGATIVLLPFAILGGAWGMSRMKRAKKENAIKTAISGCLQERGYTVAGWSKGVKEPVIVQPASSVQ
jgi:hypothetical protein